MLIAIGGVVYVYHADDVSKPSTIPPQMVYRYGLNEGGEIDVIAQRNTAVDAYNAAQQAMFSFEVERDVAGRQYGKALMASGGLMLACMLIHALLQARSDCAGGEY